MEEVELFILDHIHQLAGAVSYTHLRAHETVLDLVCRLLLEKKQATGTAPAAASKQSHIHRPYRLHLETHSAW